MSASSICRLASYRSSLRSYRKQPSEADLSGAVLQCKCKCSSTDFCHCQAGIPLRASQHAHIAKLQLCSRHCSHITCLEEGTLNSWGHLMRVWDLLPSDTMLGQTPMHAISVCSATYELDIVSIIVLDCCAIVIRCHRVFEAILCVPLEMHGSNWFRMTVNRSPTGKTTGVPVYVLPVEVWFWGLDAWSSTLTELRTYLSV